MPFTLSHPAAALPLRRWCPRLDFAALIIGSMTPDIGYYIPGFPPHQETHTPAALLWPDMFAGLMLWALLHLFKGPLCLTLPQPHRQALSQLAARRPRLSVHTLIVAATSLLLGSWTHIAWDSLTHHDRWGPQHLPFLADQVFAMKGRCIPLYELLQWLSSIVGALILAGAYRAWLRRHAMPERAIPICDGSDQWRYRLHAAVTCAAMAISLPYAAAGASSFQGLVAWSAFLFQLWVHFADFYLGLLTLTAVLLLRLKGAGSVQG